MSTTINAGRIAPIPKGLYSDSAQYVKLDIVTYSNESYICKQACKGIAPTNGDYWQLLAGAAGGGKSIVSITKTATVGLVDTYTITYTDGTTSTYQVTNGEDGQDAEEDLMVTSSKIAGTDNYYSLSHTWYELKTRVINGHNKMYVLMILEDEDLTIKMPYYGSDSDAFMHFGADVQGAEGKVMHYDLFYGDDGFAILSSTPLVQPLVEVAGATPTTNLLPNYYYKFTGAVTSLTLTLGTPVDGITNIYAFSFVAGQADPVISLPASVTIDGTPSIASGDYVEFNIMNNVAIFKVVTI